MSATRNPVYDVLAGSYILDTISGARFTVVRLETDTEVALLEEEDGGHRWHFIDNLRVHASFLGDASCGPDPSELAKAYQTAGFAVCDHFIDEAEALLVRDALLGLPMKQGSELFPEGAHAASHAGRGDSTIFIDNDACPPAVLRLLDRVDKLADQFQDAVASLQPFALIRSASASHYPNGAWCVRHVDNPDLNGRKLTIIMYFNGAHAPEHGGHLRLWPRCEGGVGRSGPVDIAPIAGRLIAFHSESLEHEVLPSRADRVALTVWYHDIAELEAHGGF